MKKWIVVVVALLWMAACAPYPYYYGDRYYRDGYYGQPYYHGYYSDRDGYYRDEPYYDDR